MLNVERVSRDRPEPLKICFSFLPSTSAVAENRSLRQRSYVVAYDRHVHTMLACVQFGFGKRIKFNARGKKKVHLKSEFLDLPAMDL